MQGSRIDNLDDFVADLLHHERPSMDAPHPQGHHDHLLLILNN